MIACSGCGVTSAELKERPWACLVTHTLVWGKQKFVWSNCPGCEAKELRSERR